MANELATRTEQAQVAIKPNMQGGFLAAMTPNNIDDAFRMAKALAQSGDMVPKHFQNKPESVMAAMLQGASIGLPPMQSLQYIAVINGRPSVWGDALPALVMAAGHFIDVEVEGEGKNRTATATLTRKDGRTIVRRFSMADADRAGLTGKPGPWKSYPDRMLQMRARAFAVRDGAADALVGLAIAEEVMDYGPDSARDVSPERASPKPGRTRYVDPDPVIDDVMEGDYSEDEPEQEQALAYTAADAIASINAANTLDALLTAFGEIYRNHRAIADDPTVIAAKDARKTALQPAPDAPADDEDIPL